MKLPLKEPLFSRYLYVSPENIVHVFMPVVSGTDIGLDNTCKAVSSLQEFFGKGNDSKTTLKGALLAYQEALKQDLSLLGADSVLAQQKQERLTQIEAYLNVVKHLEHHEELECLNKGFPSYPRPLEGMLQDKSGSNLHSIILRPTRQDAYIRSEASIPLFSVAHDSEACQRWDTQSLLQKTLIDTYSGLRLQAQNVTSQLMERVLVRLDQVGQSDFDDLQKILQEETLALTGIPINFNQDAQGKPLNQERIKQEIFFGDSVSPKEYIGALLGYCAHELLATHVESPFNYLTDEESWSIATQFLLGIVSLYCVAQAKVDAPINWGRLLDDSCELSNSLAATMAKAQQNKQSPEACLVQWINAHSSPLGLNTLLSPEDLKAIKKDFAKRYVQIKDAPHFDEFFLLDRQKKGSFVVHQGSICASFSDFAASQIFNLPQEHASMLEKWCNDFKTLAGVEIPHQNPWVSASIELDLSAMDDNALQTLYDQITTYKDFAVKKALLEQLVEERPDFKDQIDVKVFLQHVAYGQQDEAMGLLQKDPNLAQELLFAQKIPFTDYSGRTFTCSAYEYAYWAKDSHMCRMLERFMDEHTKAELLKRVQAIEELISGPEFFQQPRGLVYRKKDEEYRSAHFDLTPLKTALKHYIEEYDKNPKNTAADWAVLDKIWVEEVGRAQRNVPAHIAQEYCHPERSFNEVSQNKSLLDASNPNNLKRQLTFYNWDTNSNDLWFTQGAHLVDSGLGFSFALIRAGRGVACGGARVVGRGVDLAALTAIDEVRTNDLKQSLENLSPPLIVQDAQFHNI